MVVDGYLGLDGKLEMTRCLNCGAVKDPRIEWHQTNSVRPKLRGPRQTRPSAPAPVPSFSIMKAPWVPVLRRNAAAVLVAQILLDSSPLKS
jgi:hypothetical protein